MTQGKRTCRILKEIRKQIAEANDIEYITSECQYRGECSGTCSKCEAEVLYLCEQLDARRQMGKTVMLAGLSVAKECRRSPLREIYLPFFFRSSHRFFPFSIAT